MQRAWLAFAGTGNPSHAGIGAWGPWDAASRRTMIFGARTELLDAPRDAELAILERHRPLVSGVPG